jgi:hypothetical protein
VEGGGAATTSLPLEFCIFAAIYNRKNPFLFRDTMLKLIASDNLEYKTLIKLA